jgi:hypothetical protein
MIKYFKCRDVVDEEVTIVKRDDRDRSIVYWFFGCDQPIHPKDFNKNYTLLDEIKL